MKVKILAACLVVSLLLNAAGIVFFILFLNVQGRYRGAKRSRDQMAYNLNAMTYAQLAHMPPALERVQRRWFASHADGHRDCFALAAPRAFDNLADGAQPQNATPVILLVYLHGMSSMYIEPFVAPRGNPIADAIQNKFPSVAILSCSYRNYASWGNDIALADVTQNIREVCQEFPVAKIVLMGTSMGGCTVLTYAEWAPEDIKKLITGVVSVESAGDLAALYDETEKSKRTAIPEAMAQAFGGTPQQVPERYAKKSFLKNLYRLPLSVRVAEISAKEDEIVLPRFQHEIVDELLRARRPVKLIEVEGGHGAPQPSYYLDGFEFVLQQG